MKLRILKGNFMSFLKKIVGSRNDRILKNYRKTLDEINLLSEEIKKIKH